MTENYNNENLSEISYLYPFTYDLPIEGYRGLEFIKNYQGFPELVKTPLDIASAYLACDFNAVETMLSKKIFYNEFEPKNRDTVPITINPTNSLFLETYLTSMIDEFEFMPYESVDFAFEFFLQSFVDTYNGEYSNGFALPFTPLRDVKKRAMNNHEFDLLQVLCKRDNYIAGFDAHGVVPCSFSELEEILHRHAIKK